MWTEAARNIGSDSSAINQEVLDLDCVFSGNSVLTIKVNKEFFPLPDFWVSMPKRKGTQTRHRNRQVKVKGHEELPISCLLIYEKGQRTSQKLFAEITDYTSMRLIFVCGHMCVSVYGTHELVCLCVFVESRGQPLMCSPSTMYFSVLLLLLLVSHWTESHQVGWAGRSKSTRGLPFSAFWN